MVYFLILPCPETSTWCAVISGQVPSPHGKTQGTSRTFYGPSPFLETLLQHCHCPFQACAPILGAILRTSQLPARPCSMKRIEALTFKKKVSLHFYAAALHTHQMLLIHSQLVCPLWTFQTPQGLGMFPGYSPTVNSFNFICTPFPGSCARPQQSTEPRDVNQDVFA